MFGGQFGFICNLTEKEIMERQAVEKLVKLYSSDLDNSLRNELIHFGGLVVETLSGDLENMKSRQNGVCMRC